MSFSFGAPAQPAFGATQPNATQPAASGFGFGQSTTAPAATGSLFGGNKPALTLSLGGTTQQQPTGTTMGQPAPAASTAGGFSFGGAANASTTAPKPSLFGASTSATPAPAFNMSMSLTQPQQQQQQQQQQQASLMDKSTKYNDLPAEVQKKLDEFKFVPDFP